MLLQAGMDEPQFELPDADMEMFSLEANEFTGMDDSFIRFDTLVVSVSRDECLSHAEFRDKYGLSVLLLSCKEACIDRTATKEDAIHRSTFAID